MSFDFQKSLEDKAKSIHAEILINGKVNKRNTHTQIKNLLFAIEDYLTIKKDYK